MPKFLKKSTKHALVLIGALVLMLLHIGDFLLWSPAQKLLTWARKWPPLHYILGYVDAGICWMPLKVLVGLLVGLHFAMEPVKGIGVYLFWQGEYLACGMVFAANTMFSILVLGYIYRVRKVELDAHPLFKFFHRKKAELMAYLKTQPLWLAMKRQVRRIKVICWLLGNPYRMGCLEA